jgi:hypothetical protein
MLLPAISKKQMAEADRLMVEKYKTGVAIMMDCEPSLFLL